MLRALLLLATVPAASATRALVVIDMSVGQWRGISYRANETLATIERLMANQTEPHFDLVIDSHLALACTPPTQATICEVTWPKSAADEALLPALRFPHVAYAPKNSYSSFVDSTLDATLRAAGVTEVYLTGINTNYCVFATTLSAWERAYQVRVVLDGVTSCDGQTGHEEGLRMLHSFFVDYSSTTRVQLVRSADIPPSR